MTDRELLQQALDVIEEAQTYTSCETFSPSMTKECAITAEAIRTRLAQPEPEPVALYKLARRCLWIAYVWNDHNFDYAHKYARETAEECGINSFDNANDWLMALPKQREWVGLTDREIDDLDYSGTRVEFARDIEAKLKEKNT